MWQWLKKQVARYDRWCENMGLTPDKKRSGVPYRQDPVQSKERERE